MKRSEFKNLIKEAIKEVLREDMPMIINEAMRVGMYQPVHALHPPQYETPNYGYPQYGVYPYPTYQDVKGENNIKNKPLNRSTSPVFMGETQDNGFGSILNEIQQSMDPADIANFRGFGEE